MAEVILQIAGKLFPEWGANSVPVQFDLGVLGGPISFRLTAERSVSLQDIWTALGNEIYDLIGVHLPEIPDGPWKVIFDQPVQPTLWIAPRAGAGGGYSAYLELLLTDSAGNPTPLQIGGVKSWGPVTISMTPDISVVGLYLGHDASAGGLDVRAKVQMPTTTAGASGGAVASASPPSSKSQMVSFPFPLPPQSSFKVFELIYFGLGQKVGPDPVGPDSDDPMATIFQQLKGSLAANDPRTVLTEVAEHFYKPDRDWFIAAELGLRNINLKLLFNDPAMYGLEITALPTTPPGLLDGLLFEILYQKLGPNLGVYYGALDLPYIMRRIPLDGFILILPGFSIWIYTNGDFRVNVGWPVGPNSIGIQIDVLVGYAGFYFARLRSGDNPGAKPTVSYNPILEFGIGMQVNCQIGINASIFSATLSVSLAASLQGLLAWRGSDTGSGSITGTPDAYWFAGAASIAVLLQGSVDFCIIKASVTVAFSANVSFAVENGYTSVIDVSADVSVEVSVKVVFFTIHLSFHAHVSHTFNIGSGPPASIEGPLADGLQMGVDATLRLARHEVAEAMAVLGRLSPLTAEPLWARVPARFAPTPLAWSLADDAASPPAPPTPIELYFTLQPTAVYTSSPPSSAYVAMLVAPCPPPGATLDSPGEATGFERLVVALIGWMLDQSGVVSPTATTLSDELADVLAALGQGGAPPGPAFGGSMAGFGDAVSAFLANAVPLRIVGVDNSASPGLSATVAAMPMIPDLVLTTPAGTVDFRTFGPTPTDYEAALDIYFADMGLMGTNPSDPQAERLTAVSPTVASLAFGDYFLLLCRYVAGTLLDAARAYEKAHTNAYLAEARGLAGFRDALTPHALRVQAALSPAEELAQLLDVFDYGAAAGVGSRFLLHGLQLPDPALTPDPPTPQNMADVPTDGLYVLAGQQFADNATSGPVTASLAAGAGAPSGWLSFGVNGTDTSAVASTPAQTTHSAPQPNWTVGGSPSGGGGPDQVVIRALPPLAASALQVELKTRITWASGSPQPTIFPLPAAVTTRLAADAQLQFTESVGGGPAQPIDADAALLIRLTASPVQQATASDVPGGSPTRAGSPSTGGAGYAPFVYQLTGADEATRDLIYQALQSDLTGARLDVLYAPPGDSGLHSDLAAELLLLRNNLTTENQVAQTSATQALRWDASGSPTHNFAGGDDVPEFLRLIWELSVVNAPGYYLYYRTPEGNGLPADLFADSAPAAGSPSGSPGATPTRGTTPGTSGGAADIVLLLRLPTGGAPTAAPAFVNAALSTAPATSVVRTEVLRGGAALPAYAPTYMAGQGGFEIDWFPTVGSPTGSPTDTDYSIYQMIQYAVVEAGAYDNSVWSLPLGPEGRADWQYRQVLPLTAFLASGSPTPNRYAVIAAPWTLKFRLADVYGNALPQGFETSFETLYNDPLTPATAWPGADLSYAFDLLDPHNSKSGPALVLDLRFDAEGLVPPVGSPGGASLGDRWQAIAAQYDVIADQINDPATTWTLQTTLAGDAPLPVDPRPLLAAFVAEIQALVAQIVETGVASPSAPIGKELRWPLALSAITAQPADVVAIGVTLAAARPPGLVAPEALALGPDGLPRAPEVQQVSSPLRAAVTSTAGDGSPGGGALAAFATRFENAFARFDGHDGCLKLAQRSGSDDLAAGSLWAVRFSASDGFDVTFQPDLATFALRPLNTAPISREDSRNQVHVDVDLDAWAQQFLRALDTFLSAETCAAIAVLDERAQTRQLDDLLAVKAQLAAAIPAGLALVLVGEETEGDLAEASAALQQALLTTLASAYTISTIVQAGAQVSVAGQADYSSPGLAPPELFGTLVSPKASPADSPVSKSSPYTLSSGPLTLARGQQWLTSLLTVAQPETLATVTADLAFSVSYMQHDIELDEAHDGFVPSSWLKFVIPGDAALVRPVTKPGQPASIPVPLPFTPPVPALRSQSAVPAPMPASPPSIAAEIAEALAWDYQVQLSAPLSDQDELYFDITYNLPPPKTEARLGEVEPDVDRLFDELAAFIDDWPALAAAIPEIAAAALGGGHASPSEAAGIIDRVLTLSRAVADAWPSWTPQLALERLAEAPPIVDNFCLSYAPGRGGTTITLKGRAEPAGSPASPIAPPTTWPTLSFAQVNWIPDPASAALVDDWWEVKLSNQPGAPDFSSLQLVAPDLTVSDRQSAQFETWVVRNADIGGSLTTNPAFVYVSATATFTSPTIPMIRRNTLPPLKSAPSLPELLDELLTPLSAFSAAFSPLVRVEIGYAFGAGAGVMRATAPVLLAEGIALDSASPGVFATGSQGSPASIAATLAGQTADWFVAKPRGTRGAQLDLSITLFGLVAGRRLPLVQLLDIPVTLPGSDIEAWLRGHT